MPPLAAAATFLAAAALATAALAQPSAALAQPSVAAALAAAATVDALRKYLSQPLWKRRFAVRRQRRLPGWTRRCCRCAVQAGDRLRRLRTARVLAALATAALAAAAAIVSAATLAAAAFPAINTAPNAVLGQMPVCE